MSSWDNGRNGAFIDCNKLYSETTHTQYRNKDDENHYLSFWGFNPQWNGLFTLPPMGTEEISIKAVVLDKDTKQEKTNWEFKSGQFTYVLSAKNDAPLPEATIAHTDENGIATWDAIDYPDIGNYEYEITQIPGDIKGIHYDTSPHEYTVVIAG